MITCSINNKTCAVCVNITLVVLIVCQLTLLLYLPRPPKREPSLLIISFDGFRWDYLRRTSTPNFDRVIRSGVYTTWGLKNVFATSTLTNHWSMVTGLYPESHGIVDNQMFDSIIKDTFVPLYLNRFAINDPRYYDVPGVEPIWVTNQKQKKKGRSGSIMWWGGENGIKSVRPTYHMPYNREEDDVYKIETMMSWFTAEEPINLGLLYFPDPDHIAHKCGPESVNVTRAIARADELVGIILKDLEKVNLLNDLNIIITSDHGFTSLSKNRLIYLDEMISPSWYRIVRKNPILMIIPKNGFEDVVYEKLKAASLRKHFTVYKKDDIPERLHYKHSTRVTPIIAMADLSWAFVTSRWKRKKFKKAGTHGYDNRYQEMRPFFMAMGPSFKTNFKMDTFDIIDLYALMCKLLKLKPNPNNGTLATVSTLLAAAPVHEKSVSRTYHIINYNVAVIVVAIIGGLFVLAAIRQYPIHTRILGQVRTLLGPLRSFLGEDESTVKLRSDDDIDQDL